MSTLESTPAASSDVHGFPASADFFDLPPERIVRAFGVDYAHLRPGEGGDLYVTRYGWPHRTALLPDRWYHGQRFAEHGIKLPGSSGHVYRIRTHRDDGRALDLVVKFSRVAQDVPVVIDTSFPEDVSPTLIAEAHFNSPMEEFGLVEELRQRALGPDKIRILTQQPLAIFVPPEAFELWELGRSTSSFLTHRELLAEDQEQAVKAIELDIRRIYVLLYRWIGGRDAQDCFEAGDLDETEFRSLAPRVTGELAERGFRVLDNKPRHFILRAGRHEGGGLLRRHGRLAYGLVDFELLQRTPEHQHRYRTERRRQYWALRSLRPESAEISIPSALQPMTILSVEFVFGAAPDGGKLWVVGREPRLFDYFLPDRWRRTRRIKLSSVDEVYLTRTRDNVDVVYRRSRVGLRPREDPLTPRGQKIRQAGYNSPFEEVAIAERLRQMGIDTTYPRAVYRTGHESIKAQQLRDTRREAAYADLRTPEDPPAPLLSANYDYYTVWDMYRGVCGSAVTGSSGVQRVVGLARAAEDGLLPRDEAENALRDARTRLSRVGLPAEDIAADEFGLALGPDGVPSRPGDVLEILLTLDALSAYDYGMLPEQDYLALIHRMDERLRAIDYEKLDPNGRHLLLTVDANGRLRRDASGNVHAALCNFSLIRGVYRPIR